MTQQNPFASTFASAPSAPSAQPAPAPSAPSLGMNDPSLVMGFRTPFLPVAAGDHRFKVVGYTAKPSIARPGFSPTTPSIAIKLEVVKSTSPEYPVGSVYQKNYQWDDERNQPAATSAGGIQGKLLIQFVNAVANGRTDPASAHAWLKSADFATVAPVYVDCTTSVAQVRKIDQKTKTPVDEARTNESWRPAV